MHLFYILKLLVSCNEFCLIIPTKMNVIGMPFCCFIHIAPLGSLPSILQYHFYSSCIIYYLLINIYSCTLYTCIYTWKQVVLFLVLPNSLFLAVFCVSLDLAHVFEMRCPRTYFFWVCISKCIRVK